MKNLPIKKAEYFIEELTRWESTCRFYKLNHQKKSGICPASEYHRGAEEAYHRALDRLMELLDV